MVNYTKEELAIIAKANKSYSKEWDEIWGFKTKNRELIISYLYREGFSVSIIAEYVGCSKTTIYRAIRFHCMKRSKFVLPKNFLPINQ